MIKNILYSLLLHCLLALMIFANFHHKITQELDLKEIATIGVISLQDLVKTKEDKVGAIKKNENIIEKKDLIIPKKIVKPKTSKIKQESREILENKGQFKKNEDEKTKEIVKKVIDEKPAKTTKEEEKEIAKNEEEPSKNASFSESENLENLQLSAREKFNIQSQLKACYRRALLNTPKSNYSAVVKVTVLQDGTIEFEAEKIIDQKRYSDPKEQDYKNRMDSVIQALELCSPLRNMPFDKYEIWREFTIQFDAQ